MRIEIAEEARCEAEKLHKVIDETFTNIPKPLITQRVARALDDEWNVSVERSKELAKDDPETDWREVSKEKTEAFQEYFTFSNASGIRFYLPAYMTHYLSEFPGYGYDAVYWTCVRKADFEQLTESELKVIEDFLALCNKYEQW